MIIKDHGAFEASMHRVKRSNQWPSVRKAHLKREPNCVACPTDLKPSLWRRMVGLGHPVEVHHIIPFHIVKILGRPELELDARNLVTLCRYKKYEHHLLLGHLENYGSYCMPVRRFVASMFRGMTKEQIIADSRWQLLLDGRPKAIDKMTSDEIVKLSEHIDEIMPKVKVSIL